MCTNLPSKMLLFMRFQGFQLEIQPFLWILNSYRLSIWMSNKRFNHQMFYHHNEAFVGFFLGFWNPCRHSQCKVKLHVGSLWIWFGNYVCISWESLWRELLNEVGTQATSKAQKDKNSWGFKRFQRTLPCVHITWHSCSINMTPKPMVPNR